MPDRKKILIMIEWFAPGYKAGGPIQSCVNLCNALKEMYDMYVFTTDTDHGEEEPYRDIVADKWITDPHTGVQVFYARKKALNFGGVEEIIRKVDADFIYLNLFFSPHFILYPLWLKWTGKLKSKLIICPRGTLYDSAISLKWYLKKPFLLLVKMVGLHRKITFHATNQREMKVIGQYFPGAEIIIADNLPNVLQNAFSKCHKVAGSLRCIFVARIVPIKNLLFILHLLKEIKQDIFLTIIGPVEDESYWKVCEKAIGLLPENIQVKYEGPQRPDEVLTSFQQHHLFILPTTGENFGHAIFESLLAGRPVLISDQTPWLNLDENKAGWVRQLNDPGSFVTVINHLLECGQNQYDQYALAAWKYANDFKGKPGLTDLYRKLFSGGYSNTN